jgi:hypothetical protein
LPEESQQIPKIEAAEGFEAGVDEVGSVEFNSPPGPILYTNFVKATTTVLDIQLHFGYIETIKEGKALGQNVATLPMSPEMAKVIYLTLRGSLRSYEATFGKIRFRPEEPI